MVASYGDCLYEVSENWSADCSRTITAAFLMQEKLAISEEVSKVTKDAIKAVKDTLRKTNVSEEHPLESYCRSIEKDFAKNSNLSVLFEKVKKVSKLDNVTRRLPYSRVLLKSELSLQLLLIDKLDIPELAKLFAGMSFKKFLDNSDHSPSRMVIFVKTCVAVAKKEKFADSIQRIFEKTINDTIPEIGVPDRVEQFNSFSKDGVLFWVPKMMRVFYGYIAGDPILKKEVDSLAAVIELLNGLKNEAKFPPIPLSELVEELRREPEDFILSFHVLFIMIVASYGDRLYDVSPDLSAECSMTIKAAFLVEATLATTVEANEVILDTINAVIIDLRNATDLKEHPSELFCSRIEKTFAANSNLSASFEKAKKKAANLKNASSPPAYSPVLLKSSDSILIQMNHSLDFPEYANIFARKSFRDLLTDRNTAPMRLIILAKSCQAVARREQFADSMQKIYEKTMGDTVQARTLLKGIDRSEIIFWVPESLWTQKIMKIFYGYVANDAILKKELDSMAASMFPSASKEDLDFAKL
ncbi:hypothetical protein V9T40_001583 [Parthenolecanium corni]|uniref:Uncharacterized protein n=1 Tax=Parthenolecanium corni TaxID=536013 RepID=A0AAN9TIA6_9HEMI